jgi:hypothetical protein
MSDPFAIGAVGACGQAISAASNMCCLAETTPTKFGVSTCAPRMRSARKAYEDARPLYRQVGSVRGVLGEADCIMGLGDIALACSDHDAARKAYEEALPLYRKAGDVQGEARCLEKLAQVRGSAPT